MIAKSLGRWGLCGFFVAAAFVAVQPAAADTLRYDGAYYAPYVGSYTITDNPPGSNNTFTRTVSAGAFRMTNTTATPDNTFMAWCVDIRGTIMSSASYVLRTGEQFYGAGSRVVTDLERLASYAFDHWTTPNNRSSAAFQLAVWEIVNEGAATYSLSSGEFTATSNSAGSAARTLATSWLGVVNAGTYAIDQNLGVWQKSSYNSGTQNLAVFAPIPEPETYAMLLAGLGLMVFVARRRRQNSAV